MISVEKYDMLPSWLGGSEREELRDDYEREI